MQIKVNKKYRLTKEYLDFLTIKPQGEYIEIKMMYANTVVYSDGISQFTDTFNNLIPNLLEPVATFNTKLFKQEKKVDPIVVVETPKTDPVVETPKIDDPVVENPKTDPIIETPKTDPVVEEPKQEEPTFDPNNPYGDGGYL